MSDMPPPPPPPTPGPSGPYGVPYGMPRVPGRRRNAGLTVLLAIVTCGVWSYVWAFQNGEEMKKWSGDGLGGALHLLLTIVIMPVPMFMMAGEVEQLYRRDGKEPPITTLWGLWFLLPLIGNIVWYLRMQRALNDYWTAHGQTNEPGLL